MSYRLIALDLDGTILNSSKKVSENSKRVLQYLCNGDFRNADGERVHVVLASGRATYLIQPVSEALNVDCYYIGYNGSLCISRRETGGKVIFSKSIDKQSQSEIYKYVDENDLFLNVYGTEFVYGSGKEALRYKADNYARMTGAKYQFIESTYTSDILAMDSFNPQKCLIIFEDNDYVDELIVKLRPQFETLSLVKSNCHDTLSSQYYVEFLPKGLNKGAALVDFCKAENIPLEKVVAFGDAENDIEMLSSVGLGICLANGTEPTKKVATRVSQYSNDEDSVARELVKLFNLPESLIQ